MFPDITGISWDVSIQYLVYPPWALTTDTHLLYMELIRRLIKAIGTTAHPEKSYIQICCSYRPWSHFIEVSLDFVPQALYWIQIRTEGRPWHDSEVRRKSCGSGSVAAGIVWWWYENVSFYNLIIKTLFCVRYPAILALDIMKRQTLLPSLLWRKRRRQTTNISILK